MQKAKKCDFCSECLFKKQCDNDKQAICPICNEPIKFHANGPILFTCGCPETQKEPK